MLNYHLLIREKKNTYNEKSEISLLSTSAIYFHFSDTFSYISGRLNFADRKFCKTSREKPKSTKIMKHNPSEN